MAFDKAVDSAQLNTDLTSVANAIRTKGGTDAQLAFPAGFVSAVQAIKSAPDLQIVVTTVASAAVTATKGDLSVSGTTDSAGVCTLTVPEAGTWQITVSKGTAHNTASCVVGFTFSAEIPFTCTVKLVDLETDLLERHRVLLNGTAQKSGTTFNYTIGSDTLQISLIASTDSYYWLQTVTLADKSLGTVTKIHEKKLANARYESLYEFVPAKNVVITIPESAGGSCFKAEITAA